MALNTLEKLYKKLCSEFIDNSTIHHFTETLKKYNGTDWKTKVVFTENKYNRIKLFSNKNFEVYLICWLENQESRIHNHPEQGCVLKLLEGSLEEQLFFKEDENLRKYREKNILLNTVSYTHDIFGFHKIKANENSVSIHVYSPPDFAPTFFN